MTDTTFEESFVDQLEDDSEGYVEDSLPQVPPAYASESEDLDDLPEVLFEEFPEELEPTQETEEGNEISDEQLDRLAELDFTMPNTSEYKDSLEQIELPDPDMEEESIPEVPMSSPYDGSAQITAGGDKPLHKRSVPKVAIGVGFAVLIAAVGSMVSGGGTTQTTSEGNDIPDTPEISLPGSAPESNAGELQAQLTSNTLATEIKGRQEAKEQQAKADKEAANQAKHNQLIGATSSPATPATPPRVVFPQRSSAQSVKTAPLPRTPPRIASNRVVFPKAPVQSQVPPVRPNTIAPPAVPTAPVFRQAPTPEQEVPQMLAFGSMPNSAAESPLGQDYTALPAVQGQDQPAVDLPNSTLVAQQEAFLLGRRQTQINAGQTIQAEIEGQYLAETDTEFLVRTTSEILGMKEGSLLRARVVGMSGKYVGAEVVSVLNPSGLESPVPSGAMTVSSSSGKLLKASSNKGFFQSAIGKGLLGFGQGAADQFTSRTENFSSNQFGSSFSRGAGSKDLTSVLGSGLRGFADPILQNPSTGESALTLNPGAVTLNVNSSFSIAQ